MLIALHESQLFALRLEGFETVARTSTSIRSQALVAASV